MHKPPDILDLVTFRQTMPGHLSLISNKEQQVPGTVHYSMERYSGFSDPGFQDTGMMVYHVEKSDPGKNYLELKFCTVGNIYCRRQQGQCHECKTQGDAYCDEKIPTLDLVSLKFTPSQLSQFVKPRAGDKNFSDEVLAFRKESSFTKILPICNRFRVTLESLMNNNYSGTFENIFINAQIQILLLYSLDCITGEKEIDTITCKFLANESDRDKITQARELLIRHIGEPITIRELSRKVAMNECYLKKGFKEMYGTTIFEFYQSQRMEHAKYLLYEKGLSVTDVSHLLGYSSISHFSTAFKKHTGLKPCELLFR